jgi:hypothetical protein
MYKIVVKIRNNPCVSVKVVNFALSIIYSTCVWCSTLKVIDTVVDKRGILLFLIMIM